MKRKLRSRRGLTLAETLTALAIFAILSAVLAQGVTAAWKVYTKAVTASEARTLQSTLVQALSNELRYARNLRTENGTAVFDSDTFGDHVQVTVSDNGRVQISQTDKYGNIITSYDLIGDKAYTSGLKVKSVTVTVTGKVVELVLTVNQDDLMEEGMEVTRTIRPLHPPTETTAAPAAP